MNNPFENCILVMRSGLQQYITDNKERESETVNCFQIRSWFRQGYDKGLALKKSMLADNMIYTMELLSQNYQHEMGRLGKLPEDQAGRLAYLEMVKGFARLKDCMEAGITAEENMNSGAAGAGMLAAALNQCRKHFDAHWLEAKENIWNSPFLHGVMFEFNEALKPRVMERFDKELETNRHQFTKIMARPDNTTEVLPTVPKGEAPPAYASHEDNHATQNSGVQIIVGNNVVTVQPRYK